MESIYKSDIKKAQERMEAWWENEVIDRVAIRITAPNENIAGCTKWIYTTAFPKVDPELLPYIDPELGINKSDNTPEDLEKYFFDPDIVIGRYEKLIQDTYWAGEAIPVMCSVRIVGILAHYIGSPVRFINTNSVWSDPIIDSWENAPDFAFDPDNKWWIKTKKILQKVSKRASNKYFVALPDLNGPGAILDLVRGTEKLLIDTIENKEKIKVAMEKINRTWFRYWQECNKIIHKHIEGYLNFMTLWSEKPATDLQCDFSAMISPKIFGELFLPYIEKQTEMVLRSVYHLDGPQALAHLDLLLSVPGINAIQWVPGAGNDPMSEWIPMLQKIQKARKSIICKCEKWEVEKLVKELKPEGLLVETTCGSRGEADKILKNVKKWM